MSTLVMPGAFRMKWLPGVVKRAVGALSKGTTIGPQKLEQEAREKNLDLMCLLLGGFVEDKDSASKESAFKPYRERSDKRREKEKLLDDSIEREAIVCFKRINPPSTSARLFVLDRLVYEGILKKIFNGALR